MRARLHRINWPLWIGGFFALLTLLLAWQGPNLAPFNPMEEHSVMRVDGVLRSPPYPPLRVPGFWLGSDSFGRDLLSRILWGIRPTLMMVTAVATVRLILGLVIGLAAGWFSGRLGRLLENLIGWALALPVLLVALGGISAVGIQRGLLAFIVGLTLNGWAETARLVSEQTRLIKRQTYVEAAQALGASEIHILIVHVLRQIMPLVWMLLAFEISGVLLVSAELGFLGYYIGGGVWIEISDFVAVNVAGLPELGQMLSIALTKLTDPWGLIILGGIVFLLILSFNLLGEGLRLALSPERMRAPRRLFFLRGALGDWLESSAAPAIGGWFETNSLWLSGVVLLGLLLWGGLNWKSSQPAPKATAAAESPNIPGEHLWASERHDAQGTRWTPATGPQNPQILWQVNIPGGLAGGPAVTRKGNILLAGSDRSLQMLNPSGEALWQIQLEHVPIGAPALGSEGQIYLADKDGGLSALDTDGALRWYSPAQSKNPASAGPIVGPDGTIYYTAAHIVQAVSADGKPAWQTLVSRPYLELEPRLSAKGAYLFAKNVALAAQGGYPLDLKGLPLQEMEFSDPAFIVGADGLNYLRNGHGLLRWRMGDAGIEITLTTQWDPAGAVPYYPADAVITPNGWMLLFYSTLWGDTRLVWFDAEGKVLSNILRLPDRGSKLAAVDSASTVYLCNSGFTGKINCAGIAAGADKPAWQINVGVGEDIAGMAVVPGRLYVASREGWFYALGDQP